MKKTMFIISLIFSLNGFSQTAYTNKLDNEGLAKIKIKTQGYTSSDLERDLITVMEDDNFEVQTLELGFSVYRLLSGTMNALGGSWAKPLAKLISPDSPRWDLLARIYTAEITYVEIDDVTNMRTVRVGEKCHATVTFRQLNKDKMIGLQCGSLLNKKNVSSGVVDGEGKLISGNKRIWEGKDRNNKLVRD